MKDAKSRPGILRAFLPGPSNHRTIFLLLPAAQLLYLLVVSHWVPGRWWSELLALAMPLVLASALVLLVIAIWKRPVRTARLLALLAFIAALKPLQETFALRLPPARIGSDLTVMSFNAALFAPYRPTTLLGSPDLYDQFYAHLRSKPSPDVLCIQEFYHSDLNEELTVDSILRLGGYDHFYTNPQYDDDYGGLVGVATFSKFPAVASGRMDFGHPDMWRGHWNDFVIGVDTVRVFNMQLQSMSIRWRSLSANAFKNLLLNARDIHDRLRDGHRARIGEMADIDRYLDSSPYPVIICADLNAMPWSHTYQSLKARFHNAFEQAGSGFGFTYHHFPWFIRIDHQFFDRRLGIAWFRMLDQIDISDHYPTEAGYIIHGRPR